jgi:pyrroline-5-carboxylate reductase
VSTRKIAILGGGRIGEALLSGLLSSGWREPSEVAVTSRREERVAELRERYGAEATLDNAAAVADAGVVVVAVKPQDIDALLGEIGGRLTTEQTLVSIAAAIPTAHIEERTRATSSSRSPRSCSRTSAASCVRPRAGWTRSPPSPAPAPPTSRCSPRR